MNRDRAPARTWILVCLAAASLAARVPLGAGERPAAVAGRLYPADPGQLRAAIAAFLDDSMTPDGLRPVALVVPHAGYLFSGQIAADAYRQAQGHDYDLIVVLGTNHTKPGMRRVSVYQGEGYQTPLGLARIDQSTARLLSTATHEVGFDPAVHSNEHSVEVQVPFIQVLFPDTPIVAAVVGTPDLGQCSRFGHLLASILRGRRALIVASTDLSHYPAYEDAVATDLATLEAMAPLSPRILQDTIRAAMLSGTPGLATCACGQGPLLVAMTAAAELGASGSRVISYANSGDALVGDRSRVVGYGAVIFAPGIVAGENRQVWRPPVTHDWTPMSDEQGSLLLAFARETIRRYLETGTAPLPRWLPDVLWRRQGAFVTLEKGHRLRGCIGYRAVDRPVCAVVGAMALKAAFEDRRFQPLRPAELDSICIRISLLGDSARLPNPRALQLGRDGVLLRKSGREAAFLPEVASRFGLSRRALLGRLCVKAGLAADCWREGAELHTFQTETFSEVARAAAGP